ncbi:MAG: HrpE/YscL family type III secretion apparatus protein [Deltaproteobacteria bacterium]|jgi:type III secretion protein L|nr:HrpE/YscL family type III secretion apparatus protein [Deltaproteobacteria bacterium]
MAELFCLDGLKPSPAPGTKLLKAQDARRFMEASELAQRLRELETELVARNESEREESRKQGYQEGLAQGLDEYSFKIMDTVMASIEYLEKLESDLVEIVRGAVDKIIGELPSDEVIVRVVRKALTSMRSDRRMVVRISPKDEAAVREAFGGRAGLGSAEESGERREAASFLDIRADGRLSQGECFLESELGIVEASLQTQLRNISQALANLVKKEN